MDKIEIQKIRELPIEGVAQRLGLDVKKHACLCPFHDDHTPSLRFNVAKNTYKCFVCGAHGGVIDLALKLLPSTGFLSPDNGGTEGGVKTIDKGGVSFVDTCHWLANENCVILAEGRSYTKDVPHPTTSRTFDASRYLRYFEHPFLNDAAVDFLYNKRHLDARVVSWCCLNSYKDWLQIPYYSIDRKLIGVQSRYLGTDKKQSRFRFPYGSNCPIYNLPVIGMLKGGEPLYISEGASDCWSLLSSGHKAIAIPSATLLTKRNLKPFETLKLLGTPLHIYPDADIPGEKLYLELTRLATDLGLCLYRHSLPEGCKDYSDFYQLNHSKK